MPGRAGGVSLLVVIAALLLPSTATAQDAPHRRLLDNAANSRSKGGESATVLVYEIADFQCPYCAQFANEVFPQIDSAYVETGRVQWVFVNLPMPSHVNAWLAAEAALCAGAVSNRFWAMHNRLFAGSVEWATSQEPASAFAEYARQSGVDMSQYGACTEEDRMAPLILQDVIFGSRVTGTPTFLVNNARTVVGLKPFEEWREILDAELGRKPPARDESPRDQPSR